MLQSDVIVRNRGSEKSSCYAATRMQKSSDSCGHKVLSEDILCFVERSIKIFFCSLRK